MVVNIDEFADQFPDLEIMRMDGYDDCCIGIVVRFGAQPILCYDKQKVLEQLEADGMTPEEAEEWFEFNQIGAWVGDGTPCFLDRRTESG